MMERWRMRDPFEVVARLQEQEQRRMATSRQGRQERARDELEALFGGQMTTDIAASEIENWIAWCWEGQDPVPGSPSRCYSAEGRYLAPAMNDEGREPRRIVNNERARRVQAVYDRMPQLTRQVIRYEFTQRAAYDQWERGEELAPDGQLRKVWVCVGNTRRLTARLRLKICREQYRHHVDSFKQAVQEEFASEVCA